MTNVCADCASKCPSCQEGATAKNNKPPAQRGPVKDASVRRSLTNHSALLLREGTLLYFVVILVIGGHVFLAITPLLDHEEVSQPDRLVAGCADMIRHVVAVFAVRQRGTSCF
jgi:hypothetical protein